jgi:hypothetical protein
MKVNNNNVKIKDLTIFVAGFTCYINGLKITADIITETIKLTIAMPKDQSSAVNQLFGFRSVWPIPSLACIL